MIMFITPQSLSSFLTHERLYASVQDSYIEQGDKERSPVHPVGVELHSLALT